MLFKSWGYGFYCLLWCFVGSAVFAAAPDKQETTPIEQCKDIIFKAKTTNLYAAIAKENLKSLSEVKFDQDSGFGSTIKSFNDKGWNAIVQERYEKILHPDSDARRRLMFTLVSKYEDTHALPATAVLDQKTWQDLEMLCGPKSNQRFYLASPLDRTVTEAGRIVFYRKLVNPMTDIQQLENQQAIVAYLLKNEAFFNELNEKLKALVESENIMLSYWNPEDFFSFCFEEDRVKLPFDSKVESIKDVEEWINTSPKILQTRNEMYRTFRYITRFFLFYSCLAIPVYALTGRDLASLVLPKKVYDSDWIPKAEGMSNLGLYSMMGITSWLISSWCKGHDERMAFGRFAKGGLSLWDNAQDIYWTVRNFLEKNESGKRFYGKVAHVARYMNSLKDMAKAVAKDDELSVKMPVIKSFNEYLDNLGQTSQEMHYLLELLKTETFDGEYSSWFMYWGRIDTAFKLIEKLKDQFVEAMLALGELDAQLSIAKLYKEFKDKRVTFCFPKYIDPRTVIAPSVKAVDFWNPFIDSEKVVPSSLEVGQPYSTPQNVIITGPNAGGKSTITKAFVIAVILAQSFGIAPAKELTLTPFTKIITYLNITDDIAAGNSHFKAGVLRAQDVEKTYQACKEHEFALTAIDEVFNGTTFKEGQAAAYSLIKMLGEYSCGMCITNTHFPIIPTLESSTGRFKNYKVSVLEKPGEKIQFPFKLEPGISHQIVTLKILKEEGFGDEFIDLAQQVLDGTVVAATA